MVRRPQDGDRATGTGPRHRDGTQKRRPPPEGRPALPIGAEPYAVSESTHSWFAATHSDTMSA